MYEKTYNNMTLYIDQNQYKNIEKVSPPQCCFNIIFSFCSKFWKQKHKKTANTKFWMFEIPPKSTQEINFYRTIIRLLWSSFAQWFYGNVLIPSIHIFCFATPTSIFCVGNHSDDTLSEAQNDDHQVLSKIFHACGSNSSLST